MKREFLAAYDYGMGGVWVLVRASSSQQIIDLYPELVIVDERPSWMTDGFWASLASRIHDIDSPPTGSLATLVDHRTPPYLTREQVSHDLSPLEVQIQGHTVFAVTPWHGLVQASQPFVAALFLASPSGVAWCKTTATQAKSLSVLPTFGATQRGRTEVSFTFNIDDASLSESSIVDISTDPFYASGNVRAPAGLVFELARLRGTPRLEFGTLFLSAQDVEFGSDGGWRLRPGPDSMVTTPLRSMLMGGRTGKLHATTKPGAT